MLLTFCLSINVSTEWITAKSHCAVTWFYFDLFTDPSNFYLVPVISFLALWMVWAQELSCRWIHYDLCASGTSQCSEGHQSVMRIQCDSAVAGIVCVGAHGKKAAGVAAYPNHLFVTDGQEILFMSEFPHRENGRVAALSSPSPPSRLNKEISSQKRTEGLWEFCASPWAVSRSVCAMRTPLQPCCASLVGNFHGTSVRKWPQEMLLWCPASECAFPTADRGAPVAAQIACQSFREEMGQLPFAEEGGSLVSSGHSQRAEIQQGFLLFS